MPTSSTPHVISLVHVSEIPSLLANAFCYTIGIDLWSSSCIFSIVVTWASSITFLMMTDDNFVMRVVWAVQESLDWTIHTLRQMKTPQAAFEETHLALDACADRALQRLYSAQNVADAKKFRADVLRHGAELDRLCQDHKANLDAKNKVYERHRRLEIEKLYRRLIQAVGVDFIQNILRELAQTPSLADAVDRTAAPANQPTPPAEAEPEVVSPVEPPVRSPPANSERPAHSEASPSPAVRMCIASRG